MVQGVESLGAVGLEWPGVLGMWWVTGCSGLGGVRSCSHITFAFASVLMSTST